MKYILYAIGGFLLWKLYKGEKILSFGGGTSSSESQTKINIGQIGSTNMIGEDPFNLPQSNPYAFDLNAYFRGDGVPSTDSGFGF